MTKQNVPTMSLMPMVIEQTANGERGYDIPSLLLRDRIVMVQGGVDDNMAYSIVAQLKYLDSIGDGDIEFQLHSPGGSVYAGLAIADQMRQCRSKITTICSGFAASMGCYLLAMGTPGQRYATQRAHIMAHQVITGNDRSSFPDLTVNYRHTDDLNKMLCGELADIVGVSHQQFFTDFDRDGWMTAEAARDYGTNGFIDGVIYDRKPGTTVRDNMVYRADRIGTK